VNAGGKKLQQISGVQTYTAGNQSTEFLPDSTIMIMKDPGETVFKKRIICFSSYDGSFSVFFYACASQFYDAFFSYHKAYSNIFLILFIIIRSKKKWLKRST
jgi:hypothetical protein